MSLLDTASLIVTPNAYKEGKLYSVIPSDGSGDMSVVRATTATRVNSAGLVELVPYNLVEYSEDFSNAYWTQLGVTINTNTTTAPNGTLTADTAQFASSSYIGKTFTHSGVHTFSVYAKYIGTQWLCVENYNNADLATWFNIQSGTIGTIESGVTANIESVGNGWYRCSVTMTANSAYTSTYATFNTTTNGGFTRTGSSYFWGAQLNEGTILPYQKTETRLNIPRLDYSNGTCPSLLVEPQRTNLALYSSSFNNVAWDKVGGTMTANATTAPDGNTTAEQWAGDGTNTIHDFYQAFTGGSTTTSSIYVKKNTAQFVYISLNYQGTGSDWATGVYDLDNLTTATFQSGGVTSPIASISDEGNGWRRITLKVSTGDTNLFCMYGIANSLSPSFGPNRGRVLFSTSASFYAWGAQLELGSYATSYIPTTSASVTRNADVISKTGISSLIGQTEGTLFYDGYYGNNGDEVYLFLQASGSSGVDNSIYIQKHPGGQLRYIVVSGTTQIVFINGGSFSIGDRIKIACAYKANDFVLYLNGTQIGTDTSGTPPTCANLQLATYAGAPTSENFIAEGGTNAAVLWKTRLTNTELVQLTTI